MHTQYIICLSIISAVNALNVLWARNVSIKQQLKFHVQAKLSDFVVSKINLIIFFSQAT